MKYLFILLISVSSLTFYGQTAVDCLNKGWKKSLKGDYKGAINDYSDAIKLYPKHSLAYYHRGDAKYVLKDFNGAMEDYTKVISLNTLNIREAYYARAEVQYELQHYAEAINDYNSALKINPNVITAYYRRACAKNKIGDKDGACLDYKKAIELGYKDNEANDFGCVGTTEINSLNNIQAKVLYGVKKDKPLTNNKVYLTGLKGDTLKTTQTNEYGDFEFKKVSTQNVNIVVALSDKIKDEKQIYLAKQNGTIISTIKKTANGFTYRLLAADIKKLNPIEVEDVDVKIDAFSKSANKTITVAENIYYPTNDYKLTSNMFKKLDIIANSLDKNKTYKLEIYSHTDSKGDDAANLELSNKRANAVLDYLVSKGIDKSRITAKGMGETTIINRCINDVNCSEKEHELNRRTEFKFIK